MRVHTRPLPGSLADVTQTTRAPESVARELAAVLLDGVDGLTEDLVGRILVSDYAYAEARGLTHDELFQGCRDNLVTILEHTAGLAPITFEPARAAGRLKATLDVPLAALLHAYRLAGRLVWERLLEAATGDLADALPHLSSDIWRIIDELSSVAAEAYGRTSAELSRRDARARGQQVQALLDGTVQTPSKLWDCLRMLRLPENGTFVVVFAEECEPGHEPLPDIEDVLHRRDVKSAWLVDLDTQTGILSLASSDQLTDSLARIDDLASCRVGVSRPFDTITDAPAAHREARLAARSAQPSDTRLVRYGEAPIDLLLATTPAAGGVLAEQVMAPLFALPTAERDTLLATLAAWFDSSGSASEAAEKLHFHRNTVHQRLRRVEQLTGRSHTDPVGSAELYLALQAFRLTRPHA